MSKPILKLKSQQLRKKGLSLKDISIHLGVAKSSVSAWCKNIRLSKKQLEKILSLKEGRIAQGRLKGALFQKNKKIKIIKMAQKEAIELRKLTKNEFFIAGLALYLAEGSKKMGRVQFVNCDPMVIRFMLKWFSKFYNITQSDIRCTVLINHVHKQRGNKIYKFWQEYLKIKPEQFTKIRYITTKQKKIYPNHDNYFGTFSFRVNKSSRLLYRLNAFSDRMLRIV